MNTVARVLRDPLLHFLLLGGMLFGAYRLVHGPQSGEAQARTIVVDQPALLRFMQYQSMAFQPEFFKNQFGAMDPQAKRDLVEQYAREEALYREAVDMDLANGDYVIRRRMVQKMLYLLDDAATESFAPDEGELRQYYLAHQDRYRVAPTLTFTHVFIDPERRHPGGEERYARQLQVQLEARRVRFEDAPAYGDRFPYLQNYVKRSPDFLASQFGEAFARQVAQLQPATQWQGPIRSNLGLHLVLLTQREPAYLPPLADIRNEVREDLLRDTIAAYRENAIRDLTRRYEVRLQGVSLAPGATQPPAVLAPPALVSQR